MQKLDIEKTMRIRFLIKLAVVVSVVLLCTGFGMYSLFRLNATAHNRDFDLYQLVPQDAVAVLETDKMAEFISDINNLKCSKNNHFLYVSDIFVFLKKNLHTLQDSAPHGLSSQMNKMLLSFHEPDNPENQILYCSLGSGDYTMIESLIKKSCSDNFPQKEFEYKGEEIKIYPLSDGRFLATYITSDFLIVSFQKHLIEKVIDTRSSKLSLGNLSSFKQVHKHQNTNVEARIYVRMKAVEMGKKSTNLLSKARLGSWSEFDLKLNHNAIYCSGISYDSDSTHTFANLLRHQKPIEGFSGNSLPESTFFLDSWAASDMGALMDYRFRQDRDTVLHRLEDTLRLNKGFVRFFREHAGDRIVSSLFHSKDSLENTPCAIINIPLKDEVHAEKDLRLLLDTLYLKEKKGGSLYSSVEHRRKSYILGFSCYVLPRNVLLKQLTGIANPEEKTYSCFYKGNLLIAPDERSLSAYIELMEQKRTLSKSEQYEEMTGSLSSSYNFMMMADMEKLLAQPEAYVRLVPNFFFRQDKFFRHFIFSVQFVYSSGIVYSNIVLLYKG